MQTLRFHTLVIAAGALMWHGLSGFTAFAVACPGDGEQKATDSTPAMPQATTQAAWLDRPLSAAQGNLLDIAFESASAIPLDPHHKDRSRTQQAVITAGLELDQPVRAAGWIQRIDDWRRALCYAELAMYCAQHGHADRVQQYLDQAATLSESAEDWRKGAVKVRIAMVHAWLGQGHQAAQLAHGAENFEQGKVETVLAMRAEENTFDQQLAALDQLLATRDFDIVRNALNACAQLYNRFYANIERRALIEKKVRTSWDVVPVAIQIDVLLDLAEFALSHNDSEKALGLVNESRIAMEYIDWMPEDQIPIMARLAGIRFRAGDTEKARETVEAALALYESRQEQLLKIDRAGALRAIAEAYKAMGDAAAVQTMYARAIEAGVQSPNSRPRAEDLSATCCSMALHDVEPDAVLWDRIRAIREGLDQPW
jgi:tetratricopeptide (TPR) repeat protein